MPAAPRPTGGRGHQLVEHCRNARHALESGLERVQIGRRAVPGENPALAGTAPSTSGDRSRAALEVHHVITGRRLDQSPFARSGRALEAPPSTRLRRV